MRRVTIEKSSNADQADQYRCVVEGFSWLAALFVFLLGSSDNAAWSEVCSTMTRSIRSYWTDPVLC
jgi:hypothetical protein